MTFMRTWIIGMGAGELSRCVYVLKEDDGFYAQTYDFIEGGGVGRMHDRVGPFKTQEEASLKGRETILESLGGIP